MVQISAKDEELIALLRVNAREPVASLARKLGLSRNTVRNHGAALYRKLGVHRRTEVILWGREHGFPLQASGS